MIIYLTTDFFWTDTSSIERWPEILLKLPQKISCKSRVDVAKDYLNYKTDEKGRILRADEVYGLFGFEHKQNKCIIMGCNFIVGNEEGYNLSKEAIDLIKAYEEEREWELLLVQQLLKYSVRLRAMVIALLNGSGIYFDGGFLKNNKEAYITLDDKKYFIFNSDNKLVNLNSLLKEYVKESLGPYWTQSLELDETEEIEIQGVAKKEPSLKQVGSYFKMPFMLFDYLGWIKEKNTNLFVFDKEKLKNQINEEVYNSLVLEGFMDDIEILKSLISKYADMRGYFPVSIVGELLKDKVEPFSDNSKDKWIDNYFMNGIKKGKFRIIGSEQGQPRHGRGLLGEKEQQLIKLVF